MFCNCMLFGWVTLSGLLILASCSTDDDIDQDCLIPTCALPMEADLVIPIELACIIQPTSRISGEIITVSVDDNTPPDTAKAYRPVLSWMKCPNGTNAMDFVDSITFFQQNASGSMEFTTHKTHQSSCRNSCYIEMMPIIDTFFIVDSVQRFGIQSWSQFNAPEVCDCEAELRFKLLE